MHLNRNLRSNASLTFTVLCLFIFAVSAQCERRRNNECHKRVRRIVGGENAEVPPEDDPVVYVRHASRFAKITGVKQDQHYMFRGLRYAQPPTNKDRFQRPRRFFLDGSVDARAFPMPCLQVAPSTRSNNERLVVGAEDCLFLNVYTQHLPDGTEGLPVIVWIHGGGFKMGSASQYGVQNLVDKRIVLVTIQYRLGTFGFLSTGTQEFPGNIGLWDMALAIEWVRNYIGFFGGNPHRIVIMGQGTGASSALQLVLSHIAKGNVKAVVAMSGSALSHWASENTPLTTASEIAEENGCPTQSVVPMIKCLQQTPAESILQADVELERRRLMSRGFTSGLNGRLGPSPYMEGPYNGRSLPPLMENEPLEDFASGNVPKIPLLIGVTRDETSKAVHHNYRNEIVSKLLSIPHYLDQVLVGNLQAFTGLKKLQDQQNDTSNIKWGLSALNPMQFTNYLKIPKNDITKALQKIAEATSDALFNLPAFLTADFWSKKEPNTYLYRFSHKGGARKGRYFFMGLPLVGNESSDTDDTIGHGDDLSYLFEVQELNGSKIDSIESVTEEDVRVREIYTQMIADFARSGKIIIDDKDAAGYKSSSSNYIEISTEPKVKNEFRFCEMGLWAGITQRLQSTTCKLYQLFESTITMGENIFFDTVNVSNNGMLKLPSVTNNLKLNKSGIDTNSTLENKQRNQSIFGKLTQPAQSFKLLPNNQYGVPRKSQLKSLFGL